jgi:hypothetical protein
MSALVQKLRDVLADPASPDYVGKDQSETGIDELFGLLVASYNTFPNKFLRAELAEIILVEILARKQQFRESKVDGQSDLEWLDGMQWRPVSVKYKGPDAKGLPPYWSRELSALAWSKNESGSKPTDLECDMLLIWDANYSDDLEDPQGKRANFRKGLVVVSPDQFNADVIFVDGKKQNKTNSAFRIEAVRRSLERPTRWVRNSENRPISVPDSFSEKKIGLYLREDE